MPDWTVKDIPPKTGRIAVITGPNSGIGYEAAKALTGAGAKVIIASRNERRGAEAMASIRAATPNADIAFEPLDFASLDSVARTAGRIAAAVPRIDLLINNAGVMAIPDRHETEDGFEMQMGQIMSAISPGRCGCCPRSSAPMRHASSPSVAWRIVAAGSISTTCSGVGTTGLGAPIANRSSRRCCSVWNSTASRAPRAGD
ncbi:SDR family NAD(P)-dependent oxidoreductase [Rhizobium sp. BR 314]|uniref:SDR family NAD(P)-dependent oxidoreductase n=1 Tax=Rhizobium sp. BR 314 TaxID=3040013 RepID=UPI0039BFD43B